ncbi:multidrug/biocide efflux PACE transporter [Rahnella variigena]|uniref:multidrug/biocide efflux PACE transporter n=1 Tax=Rahnella variigena TaxID=574964 RepID=UPI000DEA5083|nr:MULTISPECIES: multidrug/biocide efflux PACE transporter [Rahnella]RBQ34750.1 Na(+)-translocating NADH-quinone reductase subunit E [Rahnella aquatilis]
MSKQTRNISQKTFGERIFHAVGFETLAVLISAPAAAWALNKPVWEMGALAIMLSTTAMVWNIVYNSLFDKFWPVSRVVRTFKIRVAHALGFEGGFIIIGLPIAALWLGIGLLDAFMLEIGFFLFFLPYTVAYNWVYDILRQRWMNRRLAAEDCPAKQ